MLAKLSPLHVPFQNGCVFAGWFTKFKAMCDDKNYLHLNS